MENIKSIVDIKGTEIKFGEFKTEFTNCRDIILQYIANVFSTKSKKDEYISTIFDQHKVFFTEDLILQHWQAFSNYYNHLNQQEKIHPIPNSDNNPKEKWLKESLLLQYIVKLAETSGGGYEIAHQLLLKIAEENIIIIRAKFISINDSVKAIFFNRYPGKINDFIISVIDEVLDKYLIDFKKGKLLITKDNFCQEIVNKIVRVLKKEFTPDKITFNNDLNYFEASSDDKDLNISIITSSFLKTQHIRTKSENYRRELFKYHFKCKELKRRQNYDPSNIKEQNCESSDLYDCIRNENSLFKDTITATLRSEVAQNRKYNYCYIRALEIPRDKERLLSQTIKFEPFSNDMDISCRVWEISGDKIISIVSPRDSREDDLSNNLSEMKSILSVFDMEKHVASVLNSEEKLKYNSKDKINETINWFNQNVFNQ